MIYNVILNPRIEHVIRVARFKPGRAGAVIQSCQQNPSGKGLTCALAISALEEKVRIIGLMPAGDEVFFSRFAENSHIRCDWIRIEGRAGHDLFLVDSETKEVTNLTEPGPAVSRKSIYELRDRLLSQIKSDDWIVFCGNLPAGANVKTYRDLISGCREKTENVLLDTSGRPLIEGVRGKPFAIKPNLTEFEGFFGEKVKGVQHLALKAKGLIDRGIRNVFVSMGEDGLLAANGSFAIRARIRVTGAANRIGCGDAMLGGFAVALKRKLPFPRVCSLGLACGEANTISKIPGMIRKADVVRFLAQVEEISI